MLTLFLCGDVMTGRGIDQLLPHSVNPTLHEPFVKDARQYVDLAEQKHGEIPPPTDESYPWGFALTMLEEMDPAARIINLETAVTTHDRYWQGKTIHYRMSPRNIGCLTAARVDCCTLANNHVLDWGYAGLAETLQSLHDVGLTTTGAGRNEGEARRAATIATRAGGRLQVFGLATAGSGVPAEWAARLARAGVAFLPDLSDTSFTKVAHTVDNARNDSDILIASIHWGSNWEYEVPAAQQNFAHRLIEDAGVDVVHGHSSHHVKGIEVYRDRLILYGCGDLITDYEGISGRESFRGDLGLMYFPQLDPDSGALQALHMQPTQMHRLQLRRPAAEDVGWLLNTLNRESRTFGTRTRLKEDGLLQLLV